LVVDNGQILLPIVNAVRSASPLVDSVVHKIGVKTLQLILDPVLPAEDTPHIAKLVQADAAKSGRPAFVI